jgi:hypothetical protein
MNAAEAKAARKAEAKRRRQEKKALEAAWEADGREPAEEYPSTGQARHFGAPIRATPVKKDGAQ